MITYSKPEWLKNRGYLHITGQTNLRKEESTLTAKIQNKSYVAKHAFFPLIHSVIKEKWFNSASDKFSEKILPISILKKIEPVNVEVLKQIKEVIDSQTFLHYKNIDTKETILKPIGLTYKNGYYLLKAFDYITNRRQYLSVPATPFKVENNFFTDKFPKFEFINTGVSSENSIEDELKNAIQSATKSKNYIRIKYKNRNDKLSFRTLREYEIKPVNDGKINYLEGYCMSRKDKRTFKLSEIQRLEILALKF